MTCPECNGGTLVIDTREFAGAVYRRRKCRNCGYKFYTEETEIDKSEEVLKNMRLFYKNGRKEK